MSDFVLNFDGSCYPNPNGLAACGYVIKKDGVVISKQARKIGTGPYSNNYGEFYGAFLGMTEIAQLAQPKDRIFVRGDSQLAIKVLNKSFRPKPESLYFTAYELAAQALSDLRRMGCVVMLDWIPRELNKEADELSKYDRK
jgi:ribonuclease HI